MADEEKQEMSTETQETNQTADKGEDMDTKIKEAVKAALNAQNAAKRVAEKAKAKEEPKQDTKDPTQEISERLTKLQERTINAELKAALSSKDVDPSKMARAIKLIDISSCVEDGEINEQALNEQIDEILTDLPSLKKQGQDDTQKGFKVGADNNRQEKISQDKIMEILTRKF